MDFKERERNAQQFFDTVDYQLIRYNQFDYTILKNILYITKPGKNRTTINDCIIMLDTESSRSMPDKICENYIVAWSLSIRVYHKNIVTLYGNKPSQCVECLCNILDNVNGKILYIYLYNLSWDWVFLKKFLINEFSVPVKQLNTKSHYPIYIEFACGLVLRDALCLGQRKLEKWAVDMGAEHQKAVGFWDYDIIREQNHKFTEEELKYIENDTLAGVECIDALLQSINKKIYSIPWTATGIPRTEVKSRGKQNHANDLFKKQVLDYQLQVFIEKIFHGGYTHGNRLYYNETVSGLIECYDFTSSYPFVMCSEKFPCERFTKMDNCKIDDILNDIDNAYLLTLIAYDVKLKEYDFPMPCLQFSKCEKIINGKIDNGRILYADFIVINLTSVDLAVVNEQYEFKYHQCINVYASYMDYLPRWFTDYVYELFKDKCTLKDVDPVRYAVAKGKLNSLYGMTVEKPIKQSIVENYETGEFSIEYNNPEELYNKFCERKTNMWNYQTGVFVTSYAFRNLFDLGKCAMSSSKSIWLYSDTDSCYALNWNHKMIESYNKRCKEKLLKNGYGPVKINNKTYWLGVATLDGTYSEMRVCGAKRYCVRSVDDGKLHITVAGVPKNGADVLNDDIENFRPGLVFPGNITGKKTHTYFFKDDIEIKNGIEYGDSIDLSDCDYLLSTAFTFENLLKENVEVPYYE